MTTLGELSAALFPGARSVGAGGPASTGTTITWVRMMRPRVPAFEGLEPGDLAIVPASTLAVVSTGREELRHLAETCRDARVGALLLVDREVRIPSAPPHADDADPFTDLAIELAKVDLPALRVDGVDVAALERAVIGYLVTGGAELERQAAALESRLERLALEGGGPTALIGAIASFFGRAIALEGPRGIPMAVHAPTESPESMLAAARYQTNPRGSVALRVPLPIAGAVGAGAAGSGAAAVGPKAPGSATVGPAGAGSATVSPKAPGPAGAGPAGAGSAATGTGAAGGALVLLGPRPPSDLESTAVGRIAGLLALELSRDEAVRRARDVTRRAEALPPAGPPWVMFLARQRVPGEADDAPEALERREADRRELRLIAPARRLALRGDADSLEIRAVLAVDPPGSADRLGLTTAARVAAFLGRTVAVSRPFTGAAERPAAEAEARAALEAAEALPDGGPVAQASLLPIYRMLGALHHVSDGDRLARSLFEPLLAGRPDVRQAHLGTLRAILDHGSLGEAATALGVHRNTISYRLRRIEEISGWNLADPEVRLALSVALRLVQNS